MNELGDCMAIIIGMLGALLKGIKNRLSIKSLFITMVIAGILCFSITGVIEMFYTELPPNVVILISFVVGWLTNEITEKLDLLIDDIYDYVKQKLKNKK